MRLISERLRGLRAGAAPGLLAVATALAVVLPAPGATAAHAPTPPDPVKAWGANDVGQLGNGTGGMARDARNTAVAVAGLTRASVRSVSAGVEGSHSLAVLRNGAVEAWGNNSDGQLGDGTSGTFNLTPGTVAGLHDVVAVAAGKEHSLALLKGGTVMAWGHNDHGQLGCGLAPRVTCPSGAATDHQSTPVKVTFPMGTPKVVAIAAGDFHSLALLSTGAVWAWGDNDNGRLGKGPAPFADQPTPVATGLTSGVKAIAAGAEHSLALLSGGAVKAWGHNDKGQLGLFSGGVPSPAETGTPTATGVSGVKAIAAGAFHSLALLKGGSVKAWGDNGAGQIGNGSDGASPVPPTLVVGGVTGVKAIAAGDFHSLALLSNGTVIKAWGANNKDQLGDGTGGAPFAKHDFPVTVRTGLTDITTLTAGKEYSLAG